MIFHELKKNEVHDQKGHWRFYFAAIETIFYFILAQMQIDDDLIPDVSSSSSPMPPDEKKGKREVRSVAKVTGGGLRGSAAKGATGSGLFNRNT